MNHNLVDIAPYRAEDNHMRNKAKCSECGEQFDYEGINMERIEDAPCPDIKGEWKVLAVRIKDFEKEEIERLQHINSGRFKSVSAMIRIAIKNFMKEIGNE